MKQNTGSVGGFFWDNLLAGFMIGALYHAFLFRGLSGYSLKVSRRFYAYILLACIFVFSTLQVKFFRNTYNTFLNSFFGIELYTAIAYFDVCPGLIYALIVVAGLPSLAFGLWNLFRRVKRRGRRLGLVLCRRLVWSVIVAQTCFVLAFSVLMIYPFRRNILQDVVIAPRKVVERAPTLKDAIEGHEDAILSYFATETAWEKLDLKGRLAVLQELVEVECAYLGLPEMLLVEPEDLDVGLLACYEDLDREIVISKSHLMEGGFYEVIDSIFHEVYHSYQARLTDAYFQVDDASKNLRMFRNAAVYADENEHYVSTENGTYEEYYAQLLESEARDYAKRSVMAYYDFFLAYSSDKSASSEEIEEHLIQEGWGGRQISW